MKATLEQLENDYWGEPDFNSHLVTECHRLRKIPLNKFTTEDLRIMLGQKFSIKHLLPLAVEILEKDPLAEGDFYPGDLLLSVLSLPKEEWNKYNNLLKRTKKIVESLKEAPTEIKNTIIKFNENFA